ncbi:MAG: hypothetical protein M1826_006908 [Phylliscum demangeonii]|nr:MAG: hypothetical protein M1826_006908 [Phylliscum demangeonii]
MVDALLEDRDKLSINLCRRRFMNSQPSNLERSITRTRKISFPGKTPREAWAFTVLVRILELVHEASIKNVVITKRDIFYKDPNLFLKQDVVDRFVDDIACTFGVERAALNVVAAAKGLVLGPLKITRSNGAILDCGLDAEGTLIPSSKEIRALDLSEIKWILVIEKEANTEPVQSSRVTVSSRAHWLLAMIG